MMSPVVRMSTWLIIWLAMANIVKITTYVTDMRYRVDLAPIREEFFGKKGPASTLVEIPSLAHADWMIEIEAIAVI